MTIRLLLPLGLCCVLMACDARSPARAPEPTPGPPPADKVATQSIMQPRVIAEARPQPTPSPSPTPVALPSATIGFAVGATLDDEARAAIARLLAEPALPQDARFVLRGSSDSLGSDRDNLVTSRRRARAVRDQLVDAGIAAERIEIIALGERRPVAPNAKADGTDDPAGRARNRRVDVEVLAPEPAAPVSTVSAPADAPPKDAPEP